MTSFNQPVDLAWQKYRDILQQQQGADYEQLALAQEAFKVGWWAAKSEYGMENNL